MPGPKKERLFVAFARNLAKARAKSSLTQEQLAAKADISPRYYQSLESGFSEPSLSVLVRLRVALDCSLDDLFRGVQGVAKEGRPKRGRRGPRQAQVLKED